MTVGELMLMLIAADTNSSVYVEQDFSWHAITAVKLGDWLPPFVDPVACDPFVGLRTGARSRRKTDVRSFLWGAGWGAVITVLLLWIGGRL
jgi:hypothetical protein